MKTKNVLLSLMTVFFLGCSNQENKPQEQNNTKNQVQQLVGNPQFRTAISEHYSTAIFKNGNPDHGAFVIDNPSGIIFGYVYDGKLIFAGANGTMGTITFLPNGNARFNINSNGPFCDVLDLSTFETLYTNQCDNPKSGRIFSNVTSAYEFVSFPFGDFYFLTEAQSGSVYKVNTSVSDALPIYDEFFEMIDCGTETVRKSVSILHITPAGNGNGAFQINLQ